MKTEPDVFERLTQPSSARKSSRGQNPSPKHQRPPTSARKTSQPHPHPNGSSAQVNLSRDNTANIHYRAPASGRAHGKKEEPHSKDENADCILLQFENLMYEEDAEGDRGSPSRVWNESPSKTRPGSQIDIDQRRQVRPSHGGLVVSTVGEVSLADGGGLSTTEAGTSQAVSARYYESGMTPTRDTLTGAVGTSGSDSRDGTPCKTPERSPLRRGDQPVTASLPTTTTHQVVSRKSGSHSVENDNGALDEDTTPPVGGGGGGSKKEGVVALKVEDEVDLEERARVRRVAAEIAPLAVTSWVERGWALPQPDGHKAKVLEDYLAEQPFSGDPEIAPSICSDTMGMTANAVLESVNLSDTPSAVAGRIEREEAIMLLRGKHGASHPLSGHPSSQQHHQASQGGAPTTTPGASGGPQHPGPTGGGREQHMAAASGHAQMIFGQNMNSFNNPLAQGTAGSPRAAGAAPGTWGAGANTPPAQNTANGGVNKGQLQVVGEARLGNQLTVKGIRGIVRSGQWRFQWQRVWKIGQGQEKVETLSGARGPHHNVTPEDCGCRLRVVSARRLPNGQLDRTILYAVSSFIPPLEAMQVAEQGGVWDLVKGSEIKDKEGDSSDSDNGDKMAKSPSGKKGQKGSGGAGDKVASLVEAAVAAEIEAERKERDETAHPEGAAVDLYRKAAKLYKQAAKKGHAEAALALGRLHERGVGLLPPHTLGTPSPAQAARWYRVAALEGHAEAMNNLGALCHSGEGISGEGPCVGLAVGWFVRAALQGNISAVCNLGLCFEEGTGVRRDWVQAEHLYREAAESGSSTALCSLGYLYMHQEHYDRAARAFVLSSEQGNQEALRGLNRLLQGTKGSLSKSRNKARNLTGNRSSSQATRDEFGETASEDETMTSVAETPTAGVVPAGLAGEVTASTGSAEVVGEGVGPSGRLAKGDLVATQEGGGAEVNISARENSRDQSSSSKIQNMQVSAENGAAAGGGAVPLGVEANISDLQSPLGPEVEDKVKGGGCFGLFGGKSKSKSRTPTEPLSSKRRVLMFKKAENDTNVRFKELQGLTGDQYKNLSWMLHRALLASDDPHAQTLAHNAIQQVTTSGTTGSNHIPGYRNSSAESHRNKAVTNRA